MIPFLFFFSFLCMKRSSNIYVLPKIFLFYCVYVYCFFLSQIYSVLSRSRPSLLNFWWGEDFGGGTSALLARATRACVRRHKQVVKGSLYLVVCECLCVCFLKLRVPGGSEMFSTLCNMLSLFLVFKGFVRFWSASRVHFPVSKNCPFLVWLPSCRVCVSDWIKLASLKLITVHWH